MATLDQSAPEEGRPPDTNNPAVVVAEAISRKQLNRKQSKPPMMSKNHNINNKYCYLGNDVVACTDHDCCEEDDNNNGTSEDNVKLVQDVNRNISEPVTKVPNNRPEKNSLKHTLPKLLCLKKTLILNDDKIERNCLKTLNVNSLETLHPNSQSGNTKFCRNTTKSASRILTNLNNSSCDKTTALAATSSSRVANKCLDYANYYAEKPRNRNSFHQNVEEALNSLLWQPYEYQNSNGRCDSISTGSCTPCSSCSIDLDEPLDNTTKNTSSLLRCNYTPQNATEDLHSNVINLTEEGLFHQSALFFCPRDGRSERSSGELGLVASVSCNSKARAPGSSTSDCDVNNRIICGGSMQSVNVNSQPSASNTVLNINAGENGLNAFQTTFDSSLNSANIVGLPSNHARYASVPSSTFQNASRSQSAIFPQHVRNISEPTNQFVKYPTQQNNNTSFVPQGSIVPTHLRQSSQVEQHSNNNLQLINHFRSSSVPKSMSIAPKQDVMSVSASSTAAMQHNNARVIQQKIPNSSALSNAIQTTPPSLKPQQSSAATPQQNNNISNVNVNFYRAVPVNVVSSVPTIHCLNTLSNDQGNSVSNVQVLPLESNNYQLQNQYQTSNNNTPFANSITTHVTVHNTNNSIQIPTNPLQINRSSAFSPQVLLPAQPIRNSNVVNASTITNFLPPPPPQTSVISNGIVNIQNSKQITAAGVPINQTNNRSVQNSNVTVPGNNTQLNLPRNNHVPVARTRTFASTEAQTDEIAPATTQNNEPNVSNREQRRRERRERRHNRRISTSSHRHTNDTGTQAGNSIQNNDRLPDILNSHLPPPYSTLPSNQPPQSVVGSVGPLPPPLIAPPHVAPPQIMPSAMVPPPHGAMLQTVVPNAVPASAFVFPSPQQVVPGQVPLMQGAQPVPVAVTAPPSGFRFPFPANGFRR